MGRLTYTIKRNSMERRTLDPEHVPQKKGKIITHLPNNKAIPKEMQKLMTKPALKVLNDEVHNELVDVMEVNKALYNEAGLELFIITASNAITLLYDTSLNEIWYPKDCNPLELTKAFYE